MKRLWLKLWRGYGYCNKCKAYAQEPCKWFFPCKARETYEHFLDRYAIILSEHYGYTILPSEVYKYENGEMNNGYDGAR